MTIYYSAHEPESGKLRDRTWDPSDPYGVGVTTPPDPYGVGVTAPPDLAAFDDRRLPRRETLESTALLELLSIESRSAGKRAAPLPVPVWKRVLKVLAFVLGVAIIGWLTLVLLSLGVA